MQIQKLAQYDDGKGLQFKEAIAEAAKRKVRLLNNLELDARLQGEEWKQEKEMYPCWTGTLIAYEAPGKPFCKTVEYEGLTFNVPKQFQGKKGRTIVCNHPDFILKDNVITPGKSAKCIPIPEDDGWYLPEKQFGIPNGEKSSDNGQTRYLWRWSTPYCGLVARDYDWWDGRDRRDVGCDCGPSARLGVFGASGKYTVPKHKHEWVCKTCGEAKGGKRSTTNQ